MFARQAVAKLMQRQPMLGTVGGCLPGYKVEIMNILRRRMSLQDPSKLKLAVLELCMPLVNLGCCLGWRGMAGKGAD